jgi:hypothetical protein
MLPARLAGMITQPRFVSPPPADDLDDHLAECTPAGGGPELPRLDHEMLRVGANDERIFGIEYIVGGQYAEQDGSARTRFAYVVGDPYAEPLTAIEMLTKEDLRRIPRLDATTRALLDDKEPSWLLGERELLPGWRRLEIEGSRVVGQILTVNPALVEGLDLVYPPDRIYLFETAVRERGVLVPTRRLSSSRASHVLQSIVGVAQRRTVQTAVMEAIMAAALRANRRLDPFELELRPFPFEWWVQLPSFVEAQRTVEKRHVSTYVFQSEDDVERVLSLKAWHAPSGKERYGFASVATVEPTLARKRPLPTTRRLRGCDELKYDSELQQLKIRLAISRFNASKRVSGASLAGKAEAEAEASSGEPLKYSLLERRWVARTTAAPTPQELLAAYPGARAWVHW